jgi:hypothetical protein
MAVFDPKSRYAQVVTFATTDRRGRTVRAVAAAPPFDQALLGFHRRRDGQRLDHLAFKYLDDPAGYWRILELANAVLPESLSEEREIPIPMKAI